MERGLLWLPLLVFFFYLAWNGWNEYQKLQAYEQWAKNFEKSKYDIYSVLGQKDRHITWGKPTRQGPINLETFSLEEVSLIRLLVGDKPIELNQIPEGGDGVLEFTLSNQQKIIAIPFTDVTLAAQWLNYLDKKIFLDS
jgi:hypothetical protein